MKREPTEPQASIKANGVGIPRLQEWEEVKQAWIHYNNFTDDTALTDGWLDWMIWQHNVNKTMYFEGRYGILTEDDKLKIANLIKDGMPSEIIIESVRLLHEPN